MSAGSGIVHRRNEQRQDNGQPLLQSSEVSFWYFAPRLGETFLGEARLRSHFVYELDGVWSTRSWGYRIYLVAYHELPADDVDSIPLHLLRRAGDHPPRKVAELVAGSEELLRKYGIWFVALHPQLWKEIGQMQNILPPDLVRWPGFNVQPIIEAIDIDAFLAIRSLDQVIQAAGLNQVIQAAGLNQVIRTAGLDQVIQTAGLDQVIQTAGAEKVVEALLSQMTPEQQEQLRQRLEKKAP